MHQDGFVAQGWYGAGLRILDVRDARDIRQLGYATGVATEVWDAYWVPVRNSAGALVESSGEMVPTPTFVPSGFLAR